MSQASSHSMSSGLPLPLTISLVLGLKSLVPSHPSGLPSKFTTFFSSPLHYPFLPPYHSPFTVFYFYCLSPSELSLSVELFVTYCSFYKISPTRELSALNMAAPFDLGWFLAYKRVILTFDNTECWINSRRVQFTSQDKAPPSCHL